ncbi:MULTISPECIES: PilZ domain-containing protein [unclassified Pseudomonas]|uniref:PilZ domain-containing protein n=1 Tax=unclassified Pseudomonas TaxID=196821 RepID=UPI002AC94B53|nr:MULTISPECIES: PilZ domain-containing protein [unclassified Pseudomonas]MEB0043493.1 PilZ domain-containing protein [Pseudomonas sp. MH10]MEB0076743.1 PilZ domain-containing protein [Pseudomonas sp. MH10out]MEB0101876.1 PilZ domain-containing protein [Pseudomonas sp. CCI3.2]MEB0131137.1 PilZ domain-containing protein [Pseudomonas sp. CCI2.4]MEB0157126.1 PilZ domain-containing protein [Pseudomonas sp. AH2 (2023)]
MTDSHADRRRFKRFAFDAKTELSQGQNRWLVQLTDLSLKGLLIQRPTPWLGDPERPFGVTIHLSEDVDVHMDVELSHEANKQLGFVCLHIGLDSISHLRRLIELNLGDMAELEREMRALVEE